MIIHTGGRTDTVRYYTEWLLRRFEEGYVLSRNPLFQNKVTRYELTPEKVDCVVFCSKDYVPILPQLHEITGRFNTYFHYTITAYQKDLEPGAPSIGESIDTLLGLEGIVGRHRIAWRYAPVLLAGEYTVGRHLEAFRQIAGRLSGHIDRCAFGFVERYRKIEPNVPGLRPMSTEEMDRLAEGFGAAAKQYKIPIQTCGLHGEFGRYGIAASGCVTLDMVGQANGVSFRNIKHKGLRQGCQSIEARDIGAYDTCLNGCKYCYANPDPHKARDNFALHDPDSPLLLGHLKETDTLQQGMQKSFWAKPEAK